ncbi:hypothetical protein BJ742DRAFT_266386 [Cladochytrium replicatum]|nr:hypothetical protein BJ742DRAFT_266386 [Cladochytrium replicatum]
MQFLRSRVLKVGGSLTALGAAAWLTRFGFSRDDGSNDSTSFVNWSGTHSVDTRSYHIPSTLRELEELVSDAHSFRRKLRPVGSGLSPNGIGFCKDGMVNLSLMDKVLDVDVGAGRVKVQAGARIDSLVEAIRPYGLTLPNYASIREQQIGGFIQTGAHGSGAQIAPVDDFVVDMKLVTPGLGTLDLSPDNEDQRELFYFARCGLGALGIVAEVTLQCVPAHRLVERTFMTTLDGVKENHAKWLKENRHLRYMWFPFTRDVCVVQCNPVTDSVKEELPKPTLVERLKPLRTLYKDLSSSFPDQVPLLDDEALSRLSNTELRDKMYMASPTDANLVARINAASAEYWKLSQGTRIGWSDEILGFDCGAQQWVSEVAFPVPLTPNSYSRTSLFGRPAVSKDIKYIEELLDLIDEREIPAHEPIEMRWTASSRSNMSPAGLHGPWNSSSLFAWVGIIQYLPNDDTQLRERITSSFSKYRDECESRLWKKYGCRQHWAKIEIPRDAQELETRRTLLSQQFPIKRYNHFRRICDPFNILGGTINDRLLISE